MIHIGDQSFNPRMDDHKSIQAALSNAKEKGLTKILVTWDDFSLTQASALEFYLPLVLEAKKMGIAVFCKMPQAMAQHLVRNQRLMFVDPLFLYKFHFKEIEFVLPYQRPNKKST